MRGWGDKRNVAKGGTACGVGSVQKHNGDYKMAQETLTTEQLMQTARETVQQMTPEEKAKVREMLDKSLQKK